MSYAIMIWATVIYELKIVLAIDVLTLAIAENNACSKLCCHSSLL